MVPRLREFFGQVQSLSRSNFGQVKAEAKATAGQKFTKPGDHILAHPLYVYVSADGMATYHGQMHAIADKLQSTKPNQSTI